MKKLLAVLSLCSTIVLFAQPYAPFDPAYGLNFYSWVGEKCSNRGVFQMADGTFKGLGSSIHGTQGHDVFTFRTDADGQPNMNYGYYGSAPDYNTYGISLLDGVCLSDERAVFLTSNVSDKRLLRYQADGTRDLSYGINGAVDPDSAAMMVRGIAATTDDRVVGYGSHNASPFEFYLRCFGEDGSLDPTFGVNGVVHLPAFGVCYDIEVQADGRLLCRTWNTNGPSGSVLLMLNSNGQPDTNFGTNGALLLDQLVAGNSSLSEYTRQPDGRILCNFGDVIVRSMPDGSLDPSLPIVNGSNIRALQYHANGRFSFVSNLNYRLHYREADGTGAPGTDYGFIPLDMFTRVDGALLTADGSLVVYGDRDLSANLPEIMMARLRPDGSLDTDFGFAGARSYNAMDISTSPRIMRTDGQGRLLFNGPGVGGTTSAPEEWVIRLDTQGERDTSFAGYGIKRFRTTGTYGLLVHPDNRYSIIRHQAVGLYNSVEVRYYGADGEDLGPVLSLNYDPSTYASEHYDHAISTPDNGTLVLMTMKFGASELCYSVMAKVNANGLLDPIFGNNGYWEDPGLPGSNSGAGLGLFPNGDILVVQFDPTDVDPLLMGLQLRRLAPDGQPVLSWGVNGVRYFPQFNPQLSGQFRPQQLIMLPQGGFLFMYEDQQSVLADRYITKFFQDGTIDSSFGVGGHLFTPGIVTTTSYLWDNLMACQFDGKFVVTEKPDFYEDNTYLHRYLPNGDDDPAFGVNGMVLLADSASDLGPNSVRLALDSTGRVVVCGNFKRSGHSSAPFDAFVFILSDQIVTGHDQAVEARPRNGTVVFPNPSSGSATLNYSTTQQGPVDISLFDAQGRYVHHLLQAEQQAGEHTLSVQWPPDAAPGTYVVRIQQPDGLRVVPVQLH